MVQVIALIDSNNFYASCEQSMDPSLRGKPLVILSNNDGCIIARSPEARQLGISMGTAYFKVRRRLENLNIYVRSSNYALYGDMSQRLMSLLEIHCEALEIYSIDEAFARLERPIGNSLYPWARRLRELIYQNLGLPIAIGIGPNKVQAKLANHLAKTTTKNTGIFDCCDVKDLEVSLEKISVEDIWGIGNSMSRWCRLQGINSAKQLKDIDNNKLRAKYGIKGIRLKKELQGDTCFPLVTKPAKKKETCVSRSFKEYITSLTELREVISSQVIKASEKLRKQKQKTKSITIFARTSPYSPSFYSKSATINLDIASNNTQDILHVSLAIINKIFKPNTPIIKTGVIMQGLQDDNYLQQHLLINRSNEEEAKYERLIKVIDNINIRYGNRGIGWAICNPNQNPRIHSKALSHSSTTRIEEIPIAKA